jgi:hypothetical protein
MRSSLFKCIELLVDLGRCADHSPQIITRILELPGNLPCKVGYSHQKEIFTMKANLSALLLAVTFLSGCYGINKMRFYPVKDSVAQTPSPAFIARMKGGSNSGEISVVLPDGETCKGPWTRVAREPHASGAPPATAEGMPAVWDSVYGQGFYVAHVLGKYIHGTAVVTGDRGTVLNVEFVNGEEADPGVRGVAKDNKANVYKVVIDP